MQLASENCGIERNPANEPLVYLGQWSNSGRDGDRLEYPAGVAIDGQGRMYVSDFFKNRIRRLECH